MKQLTVLILAFVTFAFRHSPCEKISPEMHLEELKFNFGFLHQGEITSHDFIFTNTGDEPLIIQQADVSCKCTTVDYPKSPIKKSQKETIRVTFDSKTTIGRQERTVLLKSNALNSPVTLTFKCVVLKAK